MPEVAVVPVLAAALVAFVLSGGYYAVVGDRLPAGDPEPPPPWTYGLELVRCLVVAAVVAGLVVQTGTDDWTGGLALGVATWVGFPLVLFAGSVLHEKVAPRLAAIHAGDWLLKLPVLAVLAGIWQ